MVDFNVNKVDESIPNLLSGLKTGLADDDNDGYIIADELGDFLRERVSIDSDNIQTPVTRRFTSDGGEFIFINKHIKQPIDYQKYIEYMGVKRFEELMDAEVHRLSNKELIPLPR